MAEQPIYKLYYFNFKALGEPIRVLFAYGRIKYDDIRIERSEWAALKPSTCENGFCALEFLVRI